MMRLNPRPALAFLLLLTAFHAEGQLIINAMSSPQQLVENVLMGDGVTASNIMFNGQPGSNLNAQIGRFNATNTFLALDEGLILATGHVYNAYGPNDEGGATMTTGSNYFDADLLALAQESQPNLQLVNDCAVLEFDFVPNGDSIKFNFIFASEEYIEYVNQINDAFGFFLSGPGINGPFSNGAKNIALIPGTTNPVTINTVNNVVNSQFYVNNGNGMNAPYNSNNWYVQYDGMTTVMTALSDVICGGTYHIKIVVGDASDPILDSAVFLEAGSFQSVGVILSSQIDFGGQDSTIYEGCGQATLVLSRPGNISASETIQMVTSGQAINGVDYTDIPGTYTFLPNEDSILITINSFVDTPIEGPELVQILAITSDDCGQDTAVLRFYIADAPAIVVDMIDDQVLPCNDSVFVSGTATGGFGTLVLDWNLDIADGSTGGWVTPPQTTLYTLTVTDDCGVITTVGTSTVIVPQPPPLIAQALPDTTVFCPESMVLLHATGAGGTPPYSYQWNGGLGYSPVVGVTPPETQAWIVTITDHCGLLASDEVTVTVAYDPVSVLTSPDTSICRSDTAFLSAYPSLGFGAYTLEWSDGAPGELHAVSPDHSRNYTITATDECGISASDEVHVQVHIPSADFVHETFDYIVGFPIQFLDRSTEAVDWQWDFGYDDVESDDQSPTVTYPEPGIFTVTLTITDDLGCMDSTFQVLYIDPATHVYLPNAFTPDGDGLNETFGPSGVGVLEYELRIFDRWGELVFSTEEFTRYWDGTYGGGAAPTGVYVFRVRWRDAVNIVHEHFGQVTLLR